jgi:Flp pilus assembly protein TadG
MRLKGWKRLFWRQTRGSAAVEFALIALPMAALTLACVETAVMMFTASIVQGGITAAARQIRTGAVQSQTIGSCPTGGVAASLFSALASVVTADAGGLPLPNLTYDVRSYNNFAAAQPPALTYDSQGNPTNNCFDSGAANAIVAVRVAYNYQFLTPGLGTLLGVGNANPTVPFLYTVIIQNEPFS